MIQLQGTPLLQHFLLIQPSKGSMVICARQATIVLKAVKSQTHVHQVLSCIESILLKGLCDFYCIVFIEVLIVTKPPEAQCLNRTTSKTVIMVS